LATALLAHRHPSLLVPVLAAALPWHALGAPGAARRRPPAAPPRRPLWPMSLTHCFRAEA